MRAAIFLTGAAMFVAACSDPKAASKDNFEKVIAGWIEKNPPCLSLPDGQVTPRGQSRSALPRYVEAVPARLAFAEEFRKRQEASFGALVDAGVLKATRTEITKLPTLENKSGKVAVAAYDLTEKGQKALKQEDPRSRLRGPSLCYGKPKVDEITQFTEPGEMMGVKLSRVGYRYHVADLPDWARDTKVMAAFPEIQRATDVRDGNATLVLTNEGWKHEKEM